VRGELRQRQHAGLDRLFEFFPDIRQFAADEPLKLGSLPRGEGMS
jgi:hypothetical protein